MADRITTIARIIEREVARIFHNIPHDQIAVGIGDERYVVLITHRIYEMEIGSDDDQLVFCDRDTGAEFRFDIPSDLPE